MYGNVLSSFHLQRPKALLLKAGKELTHAPSPKRVESQVILPSLHSPGIPRFHPDMTQPQRTEDDRSDVFTSDRSKPVDTTGETRREEAISLTTRREPTKPGAQGTGKSRWWTKTPAGGLRASHHALITHQNCRQRIKPISTIKTVVDCGRKRVTSTQKTSEYRLYWRTDSKTLQRANQSLE